MMTEQRGDDLMEAAGAGDAVGSPLPSAAARALQVLAALIGLAVPIALFVALAVFREHQAAKAGADNLVLINSPAALAMLAVLLVLYVGLPLIGLLVGAAAAGRLLCHWAQTDPWAQRVRSMGQHVHVQGGSLLIAVRQWIDCGITVPVVMELSAQEARFRGCVDPKSHKSLGEDLVLAPGQEGVKLDSGLGAVATQKGVFKFVGGSRAPALFWSWARHAGFVTGTSEKAIASGTTQVGRWFMGINGLGFLLASNDYEKFISAMGLFLASLVLGSKRWFVLVLAALWAGCAGVGAIVQGWGQSHGDVSVILGLVFVALSMTGFATALRARRRSRVPAFETILASYAQLRSC